MAAMKDRTAAVRSSCVLSSFLSAAVKCFAPVPAATHQTTRSRIQRTLSRWWIQVIPSAQIIHTAAQMMMTPNIGR